MGCFGSKQRDETRSANKEVEKGLAMEESPCKLLMIGTGESGKSTIARQLKIIHLKGFDEDERREFTVAVNDNVIFCIRSLIEGAQSLEIDLSEIEAEIEEISDPQYSTAKENLITADLVKAIKTAWAHEGMQEAYSKSSQFQLYDSAAYFFENIDRIAANDYVPSTEDILRVRIKTTGVTELDIQIGRNKFKIVDVGGQRNERKKWLHCFTDVTCLLFVVAASEYDLGLFEDHSINRMHESIRIFSETINTQYFERTPIILFLNKSDLFREKIDKVPLSICFDGYKLPEDDEAYQHGLDFIRDKFVEQNKQSQKVIYTHVICATDTNIIKTIFNSVLDMVVKSVAESSNSAL